MSIGDIKVSERQAGALAEVTFYSQTDGKIAIGEKDLEVTLKQMDFSSIADDGSANFNVVVKIGLTPYKDDMNKFPYTLVKKYIPDDLYVSSTVTVTKTDENMAYTVSHDSLTLNNLGSSDAEELVNTLNTVAKIGTAESMNLSIGTTLVNALIGNEENM